jgi:hypothetical protein
MSKGNGKFKVKTINYKLLKKWKKVGLNRVLARRFCSALNTEFSHLLPRLTLV